MKVRGTFTYEEAVAYIEELPKFTKKHPLNHTREFLRRLGNPGMDRKVVHVAGTNGKGSVCAYLQAILMAEGKKTGFFTSPHLVSINERICIDRRQIDNRQFLQVFDPAVRAAKQMEQEGEGHPSYFEFLFGMGMLAFAEEDVEYIILETGLGGRLDATNSVEHPAACVITSISLDHTDILGDTIEEIAAEKAGIIKPGVPVFFDGSRPEASAVIRETAEKMGALCREISKNAYEIREVNWKYIAFSRANAYDKDVIYRVPICGCYQAMNAELALQTAEYLLGEEAGAAVEKASGGAARRERAWAEVLAHITWEGRMEHVGDHMILDGAHNPGALEAFVESIRALEEDGIRTLDEPVILFSAVADKKYEQMIRYLCENLKASAYVVTEIEDRRRVPAEELAEVFRKYTERPVICKRDLKEALRTAEAERRQGGEIYCLGSLYLVGMIKKLLTGGDGYAEF